MTKAKGFVLAAVAVFAFLIGCEEEKFAELDSLQKIDGVYVVPETQEPYSGKFVITMRNIVVEAGSLKNGERHGKTTAYREDGSVEMFETFADDMLNGKTKGYYKNGKVKYKGNYKNDEKDGKWERYSEEGKLVRVERYKGGKIDGMPEVYDKNERLVVAQQGSFTDSRDKKTYKTVKIGTQTWMAENLNYEAEGSKCYGEGGEVRLRYQKFVRRINTKPVTKSIFALTALSPAEIQANCDKYGRLYNWDTAMKACPSGWHLPSNDEWQKLVDIAGGDMVAGIVLKATSGWEGTKGLRDDGNGMGGFGFLALPSGYSESDGRFFGVGYSGFWWSANEFKDGSYLAHYRGVYYNTDDVYTSNRKKVSLFSVRCAMD